MKADSKAKKRNKASAAPAAALFAGAVAAAPELPDIEYVEQLLLDSADVNDTQQMVVGEATNEVAELDAAMESAAEISTEIISENAMETAMSEPSPAIESPATELTEASGSTVTLPAQCLLRDAAEGKQQLLQHLDAATVTIDVQAVERIDTAYLQVLLSFIRSRNPQQAVVWTHVTPAMTEAVQVLGLQAALGLPELSEAA